MPHQHALGFVDTDHPRRAAPRRTPRRASSQLITSQRKPANNQYSQDVAAVDAGVAHTFVH